jgi:hypothetical protein
MGSLELSSLFKRSFATIFSHGGMLIAVMLLFQMPAIGLHLFLRDLGLENSNEWVLYPEKLGWLIVGVVSGLFCSVLAGACVTYGVLQLAQGRSLSLGSLLANGFCRMWRLLIVLSLVTVGLLVAMIPLVVLMDLVKPLSLLLLLGWVGFLFYLGLTYSILSPILVAEDVPLRQSFARCRTLINGHRSTVFGGFVLMGLLHFFVSVVFSAVFLSVSGAPLDTDPPPLSLTFASLLLGVVFSAQSSAFLGLVYHDLRANQEGATEDEISHLFE